MKKIFIMFVAMVMAVITMSAQTQYNYVGHSRFFDNTSIGISGGVQTNLHGWEAPQGAVTALTFNKEVTPTFGLTLEGQVGWNNLGNWAYPGGSHVHNGVAVDQVTAMVLGRTNLMNLFGGYKVRPFEIETVAGGGYGHTFGYVETDALLFKAGLNLNFNFGHDREWTFTLQPAVVWNTSVTGMFNVNYAVAQVTGGFTYHFCTSNGTHHAVRAHLYDNDEVNALRAALAEKPTEVMVPVTVVEERVVEAPVEVVRVVFPRIQFLQNSSIIAVTSTANVAEIAEVMKTTGTKYVLTGYASEEGTREYNERLSLERAEAVRDALVALGVDNDNLTTVGAGPVATFGDREMNRVVVVSE